MNCIVEKKKTSPIPSGVKEEYANYVNIVDKVIKHLALDSYHELALLMELEQKAAIYRYKNKPVVNQMPIWILLKLKKVSGLSSREWDKLLEDEASKMSHFKEFSKKQ